MAEPQLIADQAAWDEVAGRLAEAPALAVDTESNSMHTYRERICLIQLGALGQVWLVDPLAVADLSALGRWLAEPAVTKILHGCDYDLRSFHRDYAFRIRNLFDTGIAARFLGMPNPNLAATLAQYLGVTIPKSEALQRSNWAIRPLPAPALAYAAADVERLNDLAAALRQQLAARRRLAWVEEECARMEQISYTPPDPPETAFLRIRGSERLSPRALAVLRELAIWREEQAAEIGCPPFQVINNELLIRLATSTAAISARIQELPGALAQRWGNQLRQVIQRGLHAPEVVRPPAPAGWSEWPGPAQGRLRRLRQWRREQAERLGLDAALVWPNNSLERLALSPETIEAELAGAPEIRRWQRELLAEDLVKALPE